MQGNKRRASRHSSVWIDPALSPYFTVEADDQREPGASFLERPRHPHAQHTPASPASDNSQRRNPTTPIPQRASAQPPGSVKVRPRYPRAYASPAQESDVTRMPTLPPPTMWEYESSTFQAGSSLSSLSLVVDAPTNPDNLVHTPPTEIDIDQVDTLPPPPSPRRELTIDEIQTIPSFAPQPAKPVIEEIESALQRRSPQHIFSIEEIDTIPPQAAPRQSASIETLDAPPPTTGKLIPGSALIVAPVTLPAPVEHSPTMSMTLAEATASWTAGGAEQSKFAQRIVERKGGKGFVWNGSLDSSVHGHAPFRHPADRVRWWLLRPGHIEFVLWIAGTLLLMIVTIAFLLATIISLFWSSPGQRPVATTRGANSSSVSNAANASSHNLALILTDSGPLVAGQSLHLRGQGFTSHATIDLTYDQGESCQPGSTQTDGHGSFAVTLDDSSWSAGSHLIRARDMSSGKTASLTITLASGPMGKNTPATPAANTPTPGSGTQSTPVNTPPSPIPSPRPTTTSTPSPSPTQTTPTPGATPATTPSPGTTPPAQNGLTPTSNNSPALSLYMANHLSSPFTSAWLWLLLALGCSAALLLLGIAGAMRRRDRV